MLVKLTKIGACTFTVTGSLLEPICVDKPIRLLHRLPDGTALPIVFTSSCVICLTNTFVTTLNSVYEIQKQQRTSSENSP